MRRARWGGPRATLLSVNGPAVGAYCRPRVDTGRGGWGEPGALRREPGSQECRESGRLSCPASLQLMTLAIPLAFCALLGILAVFQVLLIIGLPLGRFAWGGQNAVLPARLRVGSAVSILVYAAFAAVALDRAGLVSFLPAPADVVAMWIIAGYLLLSVLPNLASKSSDERRVMVPVSLVLAGLAFATALGW